MQLDGVSSHKQFKRVGPTIKVILQKMFVRWRFHGLYCIFTLT